MSGKIIASQGPGRYLVALPLTQPGDIPMGRILDQSQGILHPAMSVLSITARGYWTDWDEDEADTAAMIAALPHITPTRPRADRSDPPTA